MLVRAFKSPPQGVPLFCLDRHRRLGNLPLREVLEPTRQSHPKVACRPKPDSDPSCSSASDVEASSKRSDTRARPRTVHIEIQSGHFVKLPEGAAQ